jgi:hypothetical protein
MRARLLRFSALVACVAGCIPAEDANQKVYGSVEFRLKVSEAQVTDFTDGWTFTVEHLLATPFCGLSTPFMFGSAATTSCSNTPDDGDGRTIVDLFAGAVFEINQISDGLCSGLTVQNSGDFFGGETPLVAPGISNADVQAFLATGDASGSPGLLLLGTATKGGMTKRVSLGLSQNAATVSTSCAPTKGGQPVPIGLPNVRTPFHFDFDVEQFFPGSPPAFQPLADADTNPATGNDDGVVTWDEIGRAGIDKQIVPQLGNAWVLRSSDGVCPSAYDAGADGF